MTQTVLCALGLLLLAGCNSQTPRTQNSETLRASAALEALSSKDSVAVAQCDHAVENCEARLPDAAPSGVCERLAQHCSELQEHLREVRAPAVGCWKAVEACAEHAADQAQCNRDAALCEPVDVAVTEDRATVVECSVKVEACLSRAVDLPEAAMVSCENIAAACERVNALVTRAGQARAQDAKEAAELAKAARQALDAIGDGGPGDDNDDPEDDQDGDNDGDQRARPDAGVGRGHEPGRSNATDVDD
jgi:hypothetical protein